MIGLALALLAAGPPGASQAPPAVLPAYLHPGELPPPGALVNDIRAAFPERYAVTVPPAMAALRPHTAWDAVDTVILSLPVASLAPSDVRVALADIAVAVAPEARVLAVHDGADVRDSFAAALGARGLAEGEVTWVDLAVDSVWQADFGPWSVLDDATQTQAFVDFRYFDPRPNDDGLPTLLGDLLGASTYRMPARYEGGNILADAAGRCYSTQRGLSQSGLTEAQLVEAFRAYLGCTEVVWLWDIEGDRTGHVDMAVMFPAPDRVVVGRFASGENAKRMDENADTLAGLGHAVTRLPMPGSVEVDAGFTKEQVPFSYVNASRVDGVLVWPRYEQPGWDAVEAEAAAAWAEAAPDLERVPVRSDALALLSGAVHCVMRALPAAPKAHWVPAGACHGGRCAPLEGFEALSYDGACREGACEGPRWECGCNDCTAPCPASTPCADGLTVQGCCDGDTLRWCDGGHAQELACDAGTCGWDSAVAWYACGTAGDASADAPRACGGAPSSSEEPRTPPDVGTGVGEGGDTSSASASEPSGCTTGSRRPGLGAPGLLAFAALACHISASARRRRLRGLPFFTFFHIGRPPE